MLIISVALEYSRWINVREAGYSDLDRAMSIAIEESMMDAYRSDYDGHLDPGITERAFYRELNNSLKLNSRLEQTKSDGTVVYTIHIKKLNVLEDTARLEVFAEATIPSKLFRMNITVPIELISKNGRVGM